MALSSIQYLQENNIPSLIETLLRELLTDRPTNPIAYFKETLDRLSGRSLISTTTPVPTSGFIASVPDPFTEISTLRAECENLRQEVAQLKRNSLEVVKKHADHVASVRQLALEFGKNQLSDKILELGELHADHASNIRVMMNEQLLKATNTPRVLVLFYSTYGHIYHMAKAVAEGARETGAQVCLKRVKETLPLAVLEKMNAVQAQEQFAHVSEADVKELPGYDCIIIGSPTRFGSLPAQMLSFMDATGGLWMSGALLGKVGGIFTSSATQHGGNESTILSATTYFFHHGMMIVGLPYSFQAQGKIDEIVGGSPYGATTIAGGYGQRLPSQTELEGAKFQGKHTATIARKVKN